MIIGCRQSETSDLQAGFVQGNNHALVKAACVKSEVKANKLCAALAERMEMGRGMDEAGGNRVEGGGKSFRSCHETVF